MKPIERYIQFAIDNGYVLFSASSVESMEIKYKKILNRVFEQYWTLEIDCLDDCDVPKKIYIKHNDYCNKITSKPFIEAIARGLSKNEKYPELTTEIGLDPLTMEQAIAIRDDKLDEFINNLLGEGKT